MEFNPLILAAIIFVITLPIPIRVLVAIANFFVPTMVFLVAFILTLLIFISGNAHASAQKAAYEANAAVVLHDDDGASRSQNTKMMLKSDLNQSDADYRNDLEIMRFLSSILVVIYYFVWHIYPEFKHLLRRLINTWIDLSPLQKTSHLFACFIACILLISPITDHIPDIVS